MILGLAKGDGFWDFSDFKMMRSAAEVRSYTDTL